MSDLRFTQSWCCRVDAEKELRQGDIVDRLLGLPFIVCLCCGNKRCPKANDHRLTCTQSNDPGQPGSAYADVPAFAENPS